MTNTNMSICFGVSLLSNSSTLNMNIQPSSHSNLNASMNQLNGNNTSMSTPNGPNNENSPPKSIDMATATNVFDFVLNNHRELFPGEISFTSNSIRSKPSFHQSNTSIYSTSTHKSSNSAHSNSHMAGGGEMSAPLATSEIQSSPNTPLNAQMASNPAVSISSLNNNSSILHVNRHIKKNSVDNRFADSIANSTSVNITSSNETTPVSSTIMSSILNNSSSNASNTASNNQTGSLTKQMASIFE